MHGALEKVLKTKDLAKAGDLFSLSDEEVAKGCSSALQLIEGVIAQADYLTIDGIQSVVEICVTRITRAIRETDSIEEHIKALVDLLRACLGFDLESPNSPHAKIVSDVLSCIFQNYSRKMVMEMAAPVAVLFLDKKNIELTRNVSSYLNLAVISHPHLIAPHIDCVIKSINSGNKSLLKLLPALQETGSDYLYENIKSLIGLLNNDLNAEEKTYLFELLAKLCQKKPKAFVPHLPVIADYLPNTDVSGYVLPMFEHIAKEGTQSCLDYKEQLMEKAKSDPSAAPYVTRIMGRIGRLNEVEAEECIDYLGNQLGSADASYLPLLLQQLLHIGVKFPELLKTHMDTVATFGESKEVEVKRLVGRLLELLDTKNSETSSLQIDGKGVENRNSLSRTLLSIKRRGSNDKTNYHEYSSRTRYSPRPASVTSIASDHNTTSQEKPYPDPIYQFCDKHMTKIKSYIEKLSTILPLPVKCTVEEQKKKRYRYVRLYYGCHKKEANCLYSTQSYFTLKSKHPKLWIHLMFLNLQAKSVTALRQLDANVAALGKCWTCLQMDKSDSFVRLVTSSFPSQKERDLLSQELWDARFYDIIALEPVSKQWSCFMCNNPEKLSEYIRPDGTPGITGQLKEKKGKWKLFKRWKKRYFTLSGDNITYQKTGNKLETLNVSQIESVRACRKKPRDVPRAFEIFTEDGSSYKFKSSDHKNVERWVQCLNLALAKVKKSSGRYHTVS